MDIEKGVYIAKYFTEKYGIENAKFICSRLGLALNTYSQTDLLSMGEKIALFNGWTTLDKLQKMGT